MKNNYLQNFLSGFQETFNRFPIAVSLTALAAIWQILLIKADLGNFIVADVNRNNFEQIFSKYLNEGDLLIDFADSVGTKDFVEWCANNNVMYLNTGETDWPDNWYNIFDENLKKNEF
mgnify:CR=1 FL=1